MRIRISKEPWCAGVRFIIQDGKRYASSLKFEEIQEGRTYDYAPVMSDMDAQSLMDDLWGCGFRPSEGTGSAGAMAATQNHLKDLQRLVFKGKK